MTVPSLSVNSTGSCTEMAPRDTAFSYKALQSRTVKATSLAYHMIHDMKRYHRSSRGYHHIIEGMEHR